MLTLEGFQRELRVHEEESNPGCLFKEMSSTNSKQPHYRGEINKYFKLKFLILYELIEHCVLLMCTMLMNISQVIEISAYKMKYDSYIHIYCLNCGIIVNALQVNGYI